MEHLLSPVEAEAGDTIEVTTDRPANVRLLTPAEYDNYLRGRAYQAVRDGVTPTGLVRFPVPHAGRWDVVIDLGGKPGRVEASVALLSGAAV